jgi:hypothetical protein
MKDEVLDSESLAEIEAAKEEQRILSMSNLVIG